MYLGAELIKCIDPNEGEALRRGPPSNLGGGTPCPLPPLFRRLRLPFFMMKCHFPSFLPHPYQQRSGGRAWVVWYLSDIVRLVTCEAPRWRWPLSMRTEQCIAALPVHPPYTHTQTTLVCSCHTDRTTV